METLDRELEDQKKKLEDSIREVEEKSRYEIKNNHEALINNLNRLEGHVYELVSGLSQELQKRMKVWQTDLENMKNDVQNISPETIKDWYEKAKKDNHGYHQEAELKLIVPPDADPGVFFEEHLTKKGFQKGAYEGTPLEEILDGSKAYKDQFGNSQHCDQQRFRDVDSDRQEHIRFNNPQIVKNTDGSSTIYCDIISELHRDNSDNPIYGEGRWGDLEPNRRSLEHIVSNFEYYIKTSFLYKFELKR